MRGKIRKIRMIMAVRDAIIDAKAINKGFDEGQAPFSLDGSSSSGNFGHKGRPGKVGGSSKAGSGSAGGGGTRSKKLPEFKKRFDDDARWKKTLDVNTQMAIKKNPRTGKTYFTKAQQEWTFESVKNAPDGILNVGVDALRRVEFIRQGDNFYRPRTGQLSLSAVNKNSDVYNANRTLWHEVGHAADFRANISNVIARSSKFQRAQTEDVNNFLNDIAPGEYTFKIEEPNEINKGSKGVICDKDGLKLVLGKDGAKKHKLLRERIEKHIDKITNKQDYSFLEKHGMPKIPELNDPNYKTWNDQEQRYESNYPGAADDYRKNLLDIIEKRIQYLHRPNEKQKRWVDEFRKREAKYKKEKRETEAFVDYISSMSHGALSEYYYGWPHHSRNYYRKQFNLSATEGAANFFSSAMLQDKSHDLIKKYAPETYKIYQKEFEMVADIL